MAAFEFHNSTAIDESVGELVRELVKFSKEAIEDIDNFHHDNDRAEVIYNLISENAASQGLDSAINKLEDDFREWKIGDEVYNLIVEVIACTVQACEK